jgi:hypothetical protein
MKALLALLLCLPLVALAASMDEVDYQDQDPGAAPYPTRILVTPDFLRMDSGEDAGDFILLDRKARTVYNVVRGDQRIFRYDARPVKLAKPVPWKITENVTQLAGNTRKFSLSVNGKACMEITAAPTLQPDTAAALVTYYATLAAVEADTWQRTPPDVRDPCDLAQHVLDYRRVLRYGLPLKAVYANGRSRHYIAHRSLPENPALFQLPTSYKVIVLPLTSGQ